MGLEISAHNIDNNSSRISSRLKGDKIVEIEKDKRDNLQAKIYHYPLKFFINYNSNLEEEINYEEYKNLILDQLKNNLEIKNFYLQRVKCLSKNNCNQPYCNYKAFIQTLNYLNKYNNINFKDIVKVNFNYLEKTKLSCNNKCLKVIELKENSNKFEAIEVLIKSITFIINDSYYFSLWNPKEIEEFWQKTNQNLLS